MLPMPNNIVVVRMPDVANNGMLPPKKIPSRHATLKNARQEHLHLKLPNLFGNSAAATNPSSTALWPKRSPHKQPQQRLTQSAPQSTATQRTKNLSAEIMTHITMFTSNLVNWLDLEQKSTLPSNPIQSAPQPAASNTFTQNLPSHTQWTTLFQTLA